MTQVFNRTDTQEEIYMKGFKDGKESPRSKLWGEVRPKEFQPKKQYKSRKWAVEFCGWIGLCFVFVGIWIGEFRWQLICSGLFFMILAVLVYISLPENVKEKQ